jgi:hypothetical protein
MHDEQCHWLRGWGVVYLLYLLACALQYRYLNRIRYLALHARCCILYIFAARVSCNSSNQECVGYYCPELPEHVLQVVFMIVPRRIMYCQYS